MLVVMFLYPSYCYGDSSIKVLLLPMELDVAIKNLNDKEISVSRDEVLNLLEYRVRQLGYKLSAKTEYFKKLSANDYVDDDYGLPTVVDVISEMEKPGRDPRPEFKTAEFKDGVEEIKDLSADMILEGVVTNVTNFGAFIDIGVHQDGLVHISALSNTFVKDPREVVKAGDVVKVKVMEIDIQRKRIALSMRLDDDSRDQVKDVKNKRPSKSEQKKQSTGNVGNSAMADALAQAFKR